MNESVGDVMSEGRNRAIKSIAIGAGMLIYLGMVVYSGVHNWRLLTSGVQPEMVFWAALGVISLELTAVFLPLSLHYWTFSPIQRYAALAFYVIDLGLILLNVVLDYAIVSQATEIPGWLQAYLLYGAPISPIICGLGWSVLFLLDPSQRERATIEALRAATRETLAVRVAEAARATDLTDAVNTAAGDLAHSVINATLGALPAPTPKAKARTNGRPVNVYEAQSDFLSEPGEGEQ